MISSFRAWPREALYDTVSDPFQVHNLADDPAERPRLERMRQRLRDWILQTRDLGFLPETEAITRFQGGTPFEAAHDLDAYALTRILEAAELVGDPSALPRQVNMLADRDSAVRYWAAVGLRAQPELSEPARAALRRTLQDPSPAVRTEAAGALLASGDGQDALDVLVADLEGDRWDVAIHAARTLQLLGEKARAAVAAMRKKLDALEANSKPTCEQIYVRNALSAALKQRGDRQGKTGVEE